MGAVLKPAPRLLWCPECHERHVTDRPRRTHQCGQCGHRWQPDNVPTIGVTVIEYANRLRAKILR